MRRNDGTILSPQGKGLEYGMTYFLPPGWNPAATGRRPFTPPSPSRLALQNSPQSLTAQARTESLTRRSPRGDEQLVATRTGTRRFFRCIGWALTLALRLGGFLGCGLLGLPPLTNPLPIAATLLAAALPPTLRLPPSLVGTPTPPTVCRILTRRTAIPRLVVVGLEELLAAFQKTAPLPRRLTGALP
jgi:hypothetical protein